MSESNHSLDSVISLQRQYRFQYEEAQQSYVLLYPEGLIKLHGSARELRNNPEIAKAYLGG